MQRRPGVAAKDAGHRDLVVLPADAADTLPEEQAAGRILAAEIGVPGPPGDAGVDAMEREYAVEQGVTGQELHPTGRRVDGGEPSRGLGQAVAGAFLGEPLAGGVGQGQRVVERGGEAKLVGAEHQRRGAEDQRRGGGRARVVDGGNLFAAVELGLPAEHGLELERLADVQVASGDERQDERAEETR